jgi:acetyl-CoA acyltransferase
MRNVVIAGYLRTAQSRSKPTDPAKDWFGGMRADELLAKVLPELVKRTGIDAGEIDDFIVGCAQPVGEQVTFGGRYPIFQSNFPETIPAKLLDQQCGSSMAAIHMGFLEIATDNADIVMVGGMENMTRVPMGGPTNDAGLAAPNLALFSAPEYRHWEMMTTMSMGLTAQRLLDQTDFTREDMDKWALRSHQLAAKAAEEGFFEQEILPIEVEQPDGSIMIVNQDQSVRGDTTLEALAGLRPAFHEGHQITAGNSSPVNAAASGMILMSEEAAKAKGITQLAFIRSIGFAGVNPTIMGVGPVPASRKALRKAGLDVRDVDFWEINEAFCIVALNCIKEMGIDPDKVNVMGGGTAIGHPMGATGIRLVGTLARVLQERGGTYGCANACVGGGQGVATLIERIP